MSELARRTFLGCCATGICTAATVAGAPLTAIAGADPEPDAAWTRSQLHGARVRYAKFVRLLDAELGPEAKRRMFRALGRECAIEYGDITFKKHQGDIEGFLKAVQEPSGWVEKAEYDPVKGTLRIVDRHRKCSCPLVQQGQTPADQCECTIGWQTETYSRIFGKPVVAELEESILRGGSRCVFRITIQQT